MWDYKVVPFMAATKDAQGYFPAHAAQQFGEMIRLHAADGWEYLRTDPVQHVDTRTGCLTALIVLLGGRSTTVTIVNCAVFRRPRQ